MRFLAATERRHTVFDPTRTFTSEPGRLRRQFLVGCRKMIAGVVGAEGAFREAEEVCDILTLGTGGRLAFTRC